MAIQDEITRIANAKTAIANAITAKGGTVSGTIDTFASAISALSTSSGDSNTLSVTNELLTLVEGDVAVENIIYNATNLTNDVYNTYCHVYVYKGSTLLATLPALISSKSNGISTIYIITLYNTVIEGEVDYENHVITFTTTGSLTDRFINY